MYLAGTSQLLSKGVSSMSGWTENWKAAHANYVKRSKDVERVLEHRNVDRGEIYCVGLSGGGFQTRYYVNGNLHKKVDYPSGVKAVMAYRALRDELVPNRGTAKKVTPKAKTAKKGTAKAKK
jgi:poly(3-hydroxybutyrate) depolymerase